MFLEGAEDTVCNICNIKQTTAVGSVVQIVRRCKMRSEKDKGKHLIDKETLVYVTNIASKGEGFYGHVINLRTNKLQKTNAHFRDCEFKPTKHKWVNNKLIRSS